jgi:hypothetical protein
MTRTPILVSTLLSFTTFFACGGGSKSAEEPAPAPAEEMPAEAEQPMAEEAPAETPPAETPPAEPPAPEPKTLSEDLDGDGTPEEISLAGTELSIGEAKVSLASLPAEKAATVELKVIDLNKKDKARELVIADAGAEGAGTWWVVSYDGKAKTAGEPVELSFNAEPEVKGNGSLTTTNMDCGQTITTPWKVKKGVLTKGKEKKKGKRDEAQCAAPAEGGSQG